MRKMERVGTAGAGVVLPLFTVSGRTDAFECAAEQADFSDTANLSFRIPTPLFGAGLIDNIPDAAILANRTAQASHRLRLGIGGVPNLDSAGSAGTFGWKAQHHSLLTFPADPYRTET